MSSSDTLSATNSWFSPGRRRVAAVAAGLALFACSGDTVRTEASSDQQEAAPATTTTQPEVTTPETPSEALNHQVASRATELAATLHNALGDTEGVVEGNVTTYDVSTTEEKHVVVSFTRLDPENPSIGPDNLAGLSYAYGAKNDDPMQLVTFEKQDGYWAWTQFDGREQVVDVRAATNKEDYSYFGSAERVADDYWRGMEITIAAEV